MSTYDADFAALYDLFHGDKPYDTEGAFVGELFRERGVKPPGRLLDVACGTGQHAVRFLDAGWEVLGIDRSESMLAAARARAGNRAATFLEQDMAAIDIGGRPFDVAVCLFDSIGYALTNERVQSTLTGIHRVLRDGGLFVMEFWHAAAMLTSYDARREKTWTLSDGSVTRTSETSLDVPRQVARVAYHLVRRNASGEVTGESREIHENRFFLVQEMEYFLASAGFDVVDWFGGFDRAGRIEASTWHVLVLARARTAAS
jgi:ubiquinone/menaquinone biosynthesis C-methylase UbiE